MYKEVDDALNAVKLNEDISLTDFLSKIAFGIFSVIFFGSKIKEKIKDCSYDDPWTGETVVIPIDEFFFRTGRACLKAYGEPKGKFLSFLADRELIEPHKSIAKNCRTLVSMLEDYFDNHLEEDSICNLMYKNGNFSKKVCVADSILMLFGGYENTSRSITSALYNLKHRPELADKLKEELIKANLDKVEQFSIGDLKDALYNCDYLTYVMKECLRFDNPLSSSVSYEAMDEVEIRGVKILKGQRINLNIYYPHFNPKEWHKPLEFIPERFNPDSEYFTKPGTKEARHPKALTPFMFGPRNCAGQTLAKLEYKVILSRLLLKTEYELTGSFAQNQNRKFQFVEAACLTGRFTKVSK